MGSHHTPAGTPPWRAFAADQSGNMLILFALSAPAALVLAALGTEGGALYLKKSEAQAAADQAAISAANSFNSSTTAYTVEGKGVAGAMGFVDGQNNVTVTVNSPPATGPNAGASDFVEVIVSTTQPPMLSRLVHTSNYVIDGRAVAQYGGGPGCVLALDPNAKAALSAGGSTVVNMPHCNLVSDSNASDSVSVSGSASVTVNGTVAVGGISATSGLVDNWNSPNASSVPNPYAGLSVPSTASWGSKQSNSGATTVTLQPGWYNNGLKINSGQTVTLSPGTYYIDGSGGGLDFEGGSVTGSGVTFVLTSSTGKNNSYATATINGNASFNIKAPASGAFSGVMIFEDPKASGTLTLNGNANTYFGGAIVAASMAVKYAGTGVSGNGQNCTQIIGDTVTFTGNSTIGSDCSGTGVGTIKSAGRTVLSE